MLKYLGSKRTLVPVLGELAVGSGAETAVDLFTGTTRVAQELKRRGLRVTATDVATYSGVLSDCFVATDADTVDEQELDDELARLDALPGRPGYFTETFCERSRFFQPRNGARVDAIRDALEEQRESPLFPVLLTSLMMAADRVDSTTGLQMAYLKQWAPRSHKDLELRRPELIPGAGATVLGDVMATIDALPPTDLMYLDPPYNQHRYFANYHIWETLVRWDAPEHYGVACKRIDARDAGTKSVFNSRRTMPAALASVLERARAKVLVVSYNDESWISADEMTLMLRDAGREDVRLLAFDAKRYVGAQIGIHNPAGVKVGEVKRLRNTEYVFVAGPTDRVAAAVAAVEGGSHQVGRRRSSPSSTTSSPTSNSSA
ncbi:adenine-specific DNA-methyltransferase [Nocardioides thalensis]|uniref:site-specific DNA-methyltransferase (adenine-specific) n=1 Tax=Nocardioides thalensis TaxID=1914755 RepID=A0A853C914_9ACTN|nr:DNA adenine methylase [Nocardioides thalensis]NYJ02928.1 adenine-specific DNA-methyltransferase [Nocardioides thalensis]